MLRPKLDKNGTVVSFVLLAALTFNAISSCVPKLLQADAAEIKVNDIDRPHHNEETLDQSRRLRRGTKRWLTDSSGVTNDFVSDPRSVELKSSEQQPLIQLQGATQLTQQQQPQQQSTFEELNVLALGGSVTWGATLGNREQAYPWVIGQRLVSEDERPKVHVDNLAFRATGADFPSLCIESLIEEAGSKNRSYDLILMDFVQNGTNGFPFLLKRLRQRFPKAVIVYVKLFSVLSNSWEAGSEKVIPALGGVPTVASDPSIQLVWREGDVFNRGWNGGNEGCGREICDIQEMEAQIREAGGYIFNMMKPDEPRTCITEGWFAPDWHHLSAKGHSVLANGLIEFLRTQNGAIPSIKDAAGLKPIGTWESGGDQCYNWFMSGQNPLRVTGATMVDLLKNVPFDEKWVLEINEGGATIEFDSRFDQEVPVGLGYMSRQVPPYPDVVVNLNQGATMTTIDPKRNGLPLKDVHITAFYHIGMAKPGHNIIQIHTLPQDPAPEDPFRVVGLYLCGACSEMGDLGSGQMNHHAASVLEGKL